MNTHAVIIALFLTTQANASTPTSAPKGLQNTARTAAASLWAMQFPNCYYRYSRNGQNYQLNVAYPNSSSLSSTHTHTVAVPLEINAECPTPKTPTMVYTTSQTHN